MSAKRNTPQHAAYFQTDFFHLLTFLDTHSFERGTIKQTPSLVNVTLKLLMLTQEQYYPTDMELPYTTVVKPYLLQSS